MWKTGKPYFWIFVIVFLPILGCILYLITQVVQKQGVNKIQEEITMVINPTKKINDLQAALDFADTFQNRVNLADALLENKQYEQAITHYKAALEGNFKNDSFVKMQLILCYHALGDKGAIINEAEAIKEHPDFKKSAVAFYYALALDSVGKKEEAESIFNQVDMRYSNYPERIALAEHYITSARETDAKAILTTIMEEAATMGKESRRNHKSPIDKAQKLLAKL